MGEEIPTEPPVIEPTRYYCVHVTWWAYTLPGCTRIVGYAHCCLTGALLLAWLPYSCDRWHQMCFGGGGYNPSTLNSIDGPYNSYALCTAACV